MQVSILCIAESPQPFARRVGADGRRSSATTLLIPTQKPTPSLDSKSLQGKKNLHNLDACTCLRECVAKAMMLAVANCAGATMEALPDANEAQMMAIQQALTSLQSQVSTLQAENSNLRATVDTVQAASAWGMANLNAHVVELQTKLDAALTTRRANTTIGKVNALAGVAEPPNGTPLHHHTFNTDCMTSSGVLQGFYECAVVVADMRCLASISDGQSLSKVCGDVADQFPDVQARVREDTSIGAHTTSLTHSCSHMSC